MQGQASVEDLLARWISPKGADLRIRVIDEIRRNEGLRLADLICGFMYSEEVKDGLDLRGINLEGQDLTAAQLKGAELSWANLTRVNLSRSDLRSAKLRRANLIEADLSLARVGEADLSRADLSGANLTHAHFKDANLSSCMLVECDLTGATLEGASVARANLLGARLMNTVLSGTNVAGANFSQKEYNKAVGRPLRNELAHFDLDADAFSKLSGVSSMSPQTTRRFRPPPPPPAMVPHPPPSPAAQDPGDVTRRDTSHFFGQPLKKVGSASDRLQRMNPEMEEALREQTRAAPRPPPVAPPQQSREGPLLEPAPRELSSRSSGLAPAPAQVPPQATSPRRPTGTYTDPLRAPGGEAPPSAPPAAAPAPPPPPPKPAGPRISPLDPAAAPPVKEWARVMGVLMQMKPRITRLVIEAGGKSRVVYEKSGA